jgi:hypothetical protein
MNFPPLLIILVHMEDPVLRGIYDRLKENDSEPSANKFVTIFLR